MTIERQYGAIIFVCDQENMAACEGTLETGESDWADAMTALNRAHWRVFRRGAGWIHCCSKCLVPR